jgi:uncharacterized protein
MMPVSGEGLLLVEGVTAEGWRIGGRLFAAPVLLARGRAETVPLADGPSLLAPVLALVPRPEVLLLGTGERLVWPDPEVRQAAREAGIGLEAMDSRAAARTWNVLAEEGRLVAALLT